MDANHDLPPLPEPDSGLGPKAHWATYSSDAMRAYARAAVEQLVRERDALKAENGGPYVAFDTYNAEYQRAERAEAERDALQAERESFHMDYRMKCDEETKRLTVERDALRALLVEARTLVDYYDVTVGSRQELLARIDALLGLKG